MEKKIGHKIKSISFMIDQDLRSKNEYLNPGNAFLLSFVYKNGGRVYQNTLESIFKIRRSSLSQAVKFLENEGLVERIDSNTDKRIKEIILLDKGKELALQIEKNIEENENKIRNGLSEEELNTLYTLLEKVALNFEGERK